ncbi:MAG: hypothetical protein HQ580_01300 [Planctomycetes bacterium]|nr:hypothetical protein [Planctomycetota bacterium]
MLRNHTSAILVLDTGTATTIQGTIVAIPSLIVKKKAAKSALAWLLWGATKCPGLVMPSFFGYSSSYPRYRISHRTC